MNQALAAAPSTMTIRDAVRKAAARQQVRLHWMAIGSAGLRPDDRMHADPDLETVARAVTHLGFSCAVNPVGASVIMLHRPRERDLLSQVNRLEEGARIVVYNNECDIDSMEDRGFDHVTACIFDRESGKVVRIFDDAKRLAKYIEIELTEISDSSLSIHASRIAALR